MAKTIHSARLRRLTEILTERRKEAGLTQADVARAMGRHQPFIANIESGQRRIDIVELMQLAEIMELNLHEVLEELKRVAPE